MTDGNIDNEVLEVLKRKLEKVETEVQEESIQKFQLLQEVKALRENNEKLKSFIKKIDDFDKKLVACDEAWKVDTIGPHMIKPLFNEWLGLTAERKSILEG